MAMCDLLWVFSIATTVKLLLIPSYHSTDFEVHRHWLALTSSLPLSRWYSDTTSPWSLDYPPLFAFFELLLSLPASLIDPTITHLTLGLNLSSPSSVLFLRLSTIFSDLVLLLSVHILTRRRAPSKRLTLAALVLLSPSLFIVDHVHFQYNGYLLGILMISLGLLKEGRDLAGGFVFAILICSKHLFMVAAPVYFAYLLRRYCCGKGFGRGVVRFLMMGAVVGGVFVAAFGPFVYYGQVICCFL